MCSNKKKKSKNYYFLRLPNMTSKLPAEATSSFFFYQVSIIFQNINSPLSGYFVILGFLKVCAVYPVFLPPASVCISQPLKYHPFPIPPISAREKIKLADY
jgi:hypothetical protein